MSTSQNIKALIDKSKGFILSKDIYLAFSVALVVVGFGVFMGWYNNKVVLPNPALSAHYLQEPNNPLSFMSNWDGPDYLNIEQNGYTSISQTNFFPLYPMAIRAVNDVINSSLDSALLVAWLSFVGAVYFYLKIVKLVFKVADRTEALRGLLPFILFPTAVFFLASYTESLFAFLALGAIYCALRQKYLTAALFLLLVTATNVTGLLIVALVAMMMFEQKAKLKSIISTVIIGCLGLVSYAYYLQINFQKPLGFITSQVKGHGWLQHSFTNLITTAQALNIILIVFLIVSAIYWWQRKKSFSIYSLLFLLIPLVGRQYGGFNRYVLMAFPAELMIYGYLRDKKIGYTIGMSFMAVIWAYFLFQYAGGYVGG